MSGSTRATGPERDSGSRQSDEATLYWRMRKYNGVRRRLRRRPRAEVAGRVGEPTALGRRGPEVLLGEPTVAGPRRPASRGSEANESTGLPRAPAVHAGGGAPAEARSRRGTPAPRVRRGLLLGQTPLRGAVLRQGLAPRPH